MVEQVRQRIHLPIPRRVAGISLLMQAINTLLFPRLSSIALHSQWRFGFIKSLNPQREYYSHRKVRTAQDFGGLEATVAGIGLAHTTARLDQDLDLVLQ
jgi:hypothetical protein